MIRRISAYAGRALSRRAWWLCLALVSACGLCDVPTANLYAYSTAAIIVWIAAVSALKATVLQLLLFPLLQRRFLRVLGIALVGVYSLLCLANFITWLFYDFGIGCKFFILLGQTTPTEIAEFLPGLMSNLSSLFASWHFWLGALAAAALALALLRAPARVYYICIALLSGLGIGVLGYFFTTQSIGRTATIMAVRAPRAVVQVHRAVEEWNRAIKDKSPLPDAASVSSEHKARCVFIVIGESVSRGHCSLYGYALPTTPNLDLMRDSLYVFADAVSPATDTAGSLERVLTFKTDRDVFGDSFKYPSMVDLFSCAGYKTYWLSNQERMGAVPNSATVIGSAADVVRFTGNQMMEDTKDLVGDERLVPFVSEALADSADNKLIVAHMLGSHTAYRARYPASEAVFTGSDIARTLPRPWLDKAKAQTVAEYDNSIRYTDKILGRWLKDVAEMTEPAILIYFSDHGEYLYDEMDFVGRSDRAVEVPFVVYANAAYRRENPDLEAALRSAVAKPFSTANMIHALMTLTGTRYSHYDSALDVLSPAYTPRHRYVDERPWQFETPIQ